MAADWDRSNFHLLASWFRQSVSVSNRKDRTKELPTHLAGWARFADNSLRPIGQLRRELLAAIEATEELDRLTKMAFATHYGVSCWPTPLRFIRRDATSFVKSSRRAEMHQFVNLIEVEHRYAEPVPAHFEWPQRCDVSWNLPLREVRQSDLLRWTENYMGSAPTRIRRQMMNKASTALQRDVVKPNSARVVLEMAIWESINLRLPVALELAPNVERLQLKKLPWVVQQVLKGDQSEETATSAIKSLAGIQERDGKLASLTVSDLLFQALDRRGTPDASIRSLALHSARQRATDEDVRALGYAHWLAARHTNSWEALHALQGTVRVASAWGWFGFAYSQLQLCQKLLNSGDILTAEGYDPRNELATFEVLVHHQGSATKRREADAAANASKRAKLLADGKSHAEQALSIWEDRRLDDAEVYILNQAVPWSVYLRVRLAEFEIGQHWIDGDPEVGLRSANRLASESEDLLADVPVRLAIPQTVAVKKLRLSLAIAEKDEEEVSGILGDLFDLRWPIRRTTPFVKRTVAGGEVPDGLEAIGDLILDFADREELTDGWQPAFSDQRAREQGFPSRG